MGGRVGIFLRPARSPEAADPDVASFAARRDADQALRRIARWADRLTRFSETSDLERLNADPSSTVRVGPTLAAVLRAAREAALASGGIVDPTLLEARLRAEHPSDETSETSRGATAVGRSPRFVAAAMVNRRPGIRFDLGGVAKGWIADRAICALTAHPVAIVDADGDLAIALAYGERWRIAIADPLRRGSNVAVLELTGLDPGGRERYGVATSGTTVHRWTHDGAVAHHLIDPRTRRPALTDVIQATVLADSAARAEAAAKTIVILGTTAGAEVIDAPGDPGVDPRDRRAAGSWRRRRPSGGWHEVPRTVARDGADPLGPGCRRTRDHARGDCADRDVGTRRPDGRPRRPPSHGSRRACSASSRISLSLVRWCMGCSSRRSCSMRSPTGP